MNPQNVVGGSERLIEVMGRWPSFHDAKVLSVSRSETSCTAMVHVFQMTGEVDQAGFFILKRHHLVSLEMQGVERNSLPEPYTGDVLSNLAIAHLGDVIEVRFESHLDRDGDVICKKVQITNVIPCDASGVISA